MKFEPVNRKILVKRFDAEKKKGSILIPDDAKEKPLKGEVIAVAKVSKDDDKMPVTKGQTVLFGKYAGIEVELEDKEYLILSEEDILGII